MKPLKIHLKVKFRAFGITFGTTELDFSCRDLPAIIPTLVRQVLQNIPESFTHTFYNERGILLVASA